MPKTTQKINYGIGFMVRVLGLVLRVSDRIFLSFFTKAINGLQTFRGSGLCKMRECGNAGVRERIRVKSNDELHTVQYYSHRRGALSDGAL